MRTLMMIGAAVGLLLMPGAAMANWVDNFDSYALGSINGQGGWGGWGGDPAAAGTVVDNPYLSPLQSQKINGPADSVHTYTGYTTGHWTYALDQFIPTAFAGTNPTYFILNNTYVTGGAEVNWSVQVGFNSTTNQIDADCGSSAQVHIPFIRNEWVPIRVEIFLDEDWTQVYYNNTLLDDPALANHPTLGGGYQWTTGVFGSDTDGLLNIAAVDLFAYNSSDVYYDNMSLTPEPASLVLLGLGALLVARRRR